MSIQRAQRPNSGFTLILDEVLRDSRLSYRARGILAAILSRPDNWTTTAEQLAAEGKEGRDAVRSALKELDDAGYIERRKEQVERGRWTTRTIVYDRPRTTPPATDQAPADKAAAPTPDNPSPVADNPSPETDFQPSVDQPSVSQALRRKTEKKTKNSSSTTADAAAEMTAGDATSTSTSAAVERLCVHFADRIASNDLPRPPITSSWRTQCQLLLDSGTTEDQVHVVIDWCQDDPFWAPNVMSMSKLRARFPELQLRSRNQRTLRDRKQTEDAEGEAKRLRARRLAQAPEPIPPAHLSGSEAAAWLRDARRRIADGEPLSTSTEKLVSA